MEPLSTHTSGQIHSDFIRADSPKDAAALELITQAIRHNIILNQLEDKNLHEFVNAMEPRVIPAGSTLTEEGETGDYCYVIEWGKVCTSLRFLSSLRTSAEGCGMLEIVCVHAFGDVRLRNHYQQVAALASNLISDREARSRKLAGWHSGSWPTVG